MFRRALSAWCLPRRRRLASGLGLDPRAGDEFLETLAVVAIVVVLVGLAFEGYRPAVHKATIAEAASLMSRHRTEIATELAETGRLPETIPTREGTFGTEGRFFAGVDWIDNEIVLPLRPDLASRMVTFAASGAAPAGSLSFRVARVAETGRAVILCGTATAPNGFVADPSRHTSISNEFLPFFCRI